METGTEVSHYIQPLDTIKGHCKQELYVVGSLPRCIIKFLIQ